MISSTQGIVFRQTKYSETSVIVAIYTLEYGLQSYIVQGIRKQGSKQKAALLQPGNVLELQVYYRPEKKLNRIKEMRSSLVFKIIPFDVVRGMLLLFIIEICNLSIREVEKNEALFSYLVSSLHRLDDPSQDVTIFPQQFMIYLSHHLGFKPSYSSGVFFDLQEGIFLKEQPVHPNFIKKESAELLKQILQTEGWEKLEKKFSKKTRLSLLNALVVYYSLHIQSFGKIKSLSVFQKINT